jgi:hypothetical protein
MTDHASRNPRNLTVEHRGTEHIEENQRRGRPVNQLTRRHSLARSDFGVELEGHPQVPELASVPCLSTAMH